MLVPLMACYSMLENSTLASSFLYWFLIISLDIRSLKHLWWLSFGIGSSEYSSFVTFRYGICSFSYSWLLICESMAWSGWFASAGPRRLHVVLACHVKRAHSWVVNHEKFQHIRSILSEPIIAQSDSTNLMTSELAYQRAEISVFELLMILYCIGIAK